MSHKYSRQLSHNKPKKLKQKKISDAWLVNIKHSENYFSLLIKKRVTVKMKLKNYRCLVFILSLSRFLAAAKPRGVLKATLPFLALLEE